MNKPTEQPNTRERLIAAMADALQRRGLHGVGVNEVLAQAGAPKGVLYHHFPGGKVELAVAAIQAVVAHLRATLTQLQASQGEALQVLRVWLEQARRQLEQSGFERGCPLATVALESGADDQTLRAALAAGFAEIRQLLAGLLGQAGVPEERAGALATLTVAAYEGALLQARVAGDGQALQVTMNLLLEWIGGEIEAVGVTR
ncbi:TetR/AcrR family transcriptional regulator [Pseudomonas sp. LS44]|uniref:TetR/AcrR family transcriptional regulator n=1 Tax=Pseudomonas sp. LS44 TaxID=1357074 RepID=UPI00215A842B|nr:TetR/AcrR family transcriptional regulator [Pseudomonas sp. LS44]UVE16708.1 TetR/AcrR family transcriptional regulator [Pseudomonas sp. LS44]